MFDSVLSAFADLNEPLSIHAHLQPDGRLSGGVFIPLDYDKILDFAGTAKKKS